MKLRHAKLIDFTGELGQFKQYSGFTPEVVTELRNKEKAEVAIIVDRAYCQGLGENVPYLVSDHLNLTGDNPLVGPNNPVGERFPVVNNIYLGAADTMDQEETWAIGNPLGKFATGVAAGLKAGVVPGGEEIKFLRELGVSLYCYNLVPAMLVAAHAGLKVIGIALPQGESLSKDVLACLLR
ncbi:MAG TPA: hypothetical protein PL012_12825 [Candidatus Obscuribacter sp.]|nr:hypothetical protein [Candidatus Obscuribacter sp.]